MAREDLPNESSWMVEPGEIAEFTLILLLGNVCMFGLFGLGASFWFRDWDYLLGAGQLAFFVVVVVALLFAPAMVILSKVSYLGWAAITDAWGAADAE